MIGYSLIGPVLGLVLGAVVPNRRLASFFITGGLVYCSAALVVLTAGSIEAHFHFFIMIGFIALYQDWVPFLWNVVFTVLSHGVGRRWLGGLMFDHAAGQASPWLWSLIHGLAVLAACVGVVIFWRLTEDEQAEKEELGRQLLTADAELGRAGSPRSCWSTWPGATRACSTGSSTSSTSWRSRSRTRTRWPTCSGSTTWRPGSGATPRACSCSSGEEPPRRGRARCRCVDVVRAAIAETEDLDRVAFIVDERLAVLGHAVTDLTHLLAELTENAVRFSPPDTTVTIRARPHPTRWRMAAC